MGGFFAKALQKITKKEEIRILMLGLDSAGKTTIFYKIKSPGYYVYPNNCGIDTVEYKNISFTSWDLGSCHSKMRPLWRHYYPSTNGIIFVVDSNDRKHINGDYCNNERINLYSFGYIREFVIKTKLSNCMPSDLFTVIFEYCKCKEHEDNAQDELNKLLSEDELSDIPLLVFANKQDLPNALSVNEVSEQLGLNKILQKNRKWHIEKTCATNGDGLYEGFKWINNQIKQKKINHLDDNV